MLRENVQEWTREWLEQGRAQGLEQGRAQGLEQGRVQGLARARGEERALLCRQAARKFDDDAAEELAAALDGVTDPERLRRVGDLDHRVRDGLELARPRRDGSVGGNPDDAGHPAMDP